MVTKTWMPGTSPGITVPQSASAREPEWLGHAGADRLGRLDDHLLGERRQILGLRGDQLELLALMREETFEHFGQRLGPGQLVRHVKRRIGIDARDLEHFPLILARAALGAGVDLFER